MQRSLFPSGPRSARSIRFAALLLAFGLVASACGSSSGSKTVVSGAASSAVSGGDVGSSASAVAGIDVAFTNFDGSARNLSEYSGKPLVVNFFAGWCPACNAEMPDFEAVHQELGDSVTFVGLSIDSVAADALDVIARTGVTYDTGWDPNTSAYNFFGGFAMPTTAFIDSAGTVVEVFSGALDVNTLREKLKQIT